jgi:protein O-mannosyl-transferase
MTEPSTAPTPPGDDAVLSRSAPASPIWRLVPALTILLLVLASSATSLANGFAYDDRHIITDNPAVKNLANWWQLFGQPYWPAKAVASLYRPLTVLSFSLQWAAGRGSPAIFHVLNVLLYAGCCLAVLRLARLLLPLGPAWLVAAFFAVHPVHVEAVGNVVGQAELTVALCLVLATTIYVRARADGGVPGPGEVVGMLVLYAVGCLFKEQGVVLPALLAAAEMTVVRDARPWRARVASLRPFALALVMVALAYLAVRGRVVDGVGDVPHPAFVNLPTPHRWLTMLGVVPEWARLLVWPAHLAADYSPQQIPIRTSLDLTAVLGLLLILAVIVLGVACARRAPVVTFGVLWLAVTMAPVSNFLLPTGIILAERTLFLPSLGFLLVVGAAVPWAEASLRAARPLAARLAAALVILLIIAGAWRSADRQRVWKDNDAIFGSLLRDAPLNYKSHYAYGGMLFQRGDRKMGEREWQTAIALMPTHSGIYADLGNAYREAHLCEPAVAMYRKTLELEPSRATARAGLAACLLEMADFQGARREARRGYAYGTAMQTFRYLARVADSVLVARAAGAPAQPAVLR